MQNLKKTVVKRYADHYDSLTFRKKRWEPAGPQVFRFSRQQNYFSGKHKKLVASENDLVALVSSVNLVAVKWHIMSLIIICESEKCFYHCSLLKLGKQIPTPLFRVGQTILCFH